MGIRSVGIEEEFLVFDAGAPTLRDIGPELADRAERDGADDAQFEKELKRAQVEHASPPSTALPELRRALVGQRAGLVAAAAARDARIVASGTSPVRGTSATTHEPRYERMEDRFAAVLRAELTCAMHVHVSVDSDDEAVHVLDRIAPWLPVLSALTANSPMHAGQDTGYAAFRRMIWNQWPTAGPTGPLGDGPAYHRVVQSLIASGAAQDRGMIYFDARLAADYPTVEIRVCDVCSSIDDALTVAALARALVETAAAQDGPSGVRLELLRAGSWRAARFGLSSELVDPRDVAAGALAPAWTVVDALTEHVGAALDAAGDSDAVQAGLAAIKSGGNGAERQRAAARHGGPTAAVDATTLTEQDADAPT